MYVPTTRRINPPSPSVAPLVAGNVSFFQVCMGVCARVNIATHRKSFDVAGRARLSIKSAGYTMNVVHDKQIFIIVDLTFKHMEYRSRRCTSNIFDGAILLEFFSHLLVERSQWKEAVFNDLSSANCAPVGYAFSPPKVYEERDIFIFALVAFFVFLLWGVKKLTESTVRVSIAM